MSTAIPFDHPAGAAAIDRLRALPEPKRERVKVLINRRLYDRANVESTKPLGFDPSSEEMALAEQFADAIVDMVVQAGLGRKEGGA